MKLIQPTLLLDKSRCLRNLKRMQSKADRNQITLRPHFKTHQSHEIGRWFKEIGVQKITVSTIDMALYFAADGWNDITVAFPVNILEIDKINRLARRIKLNLLVENPDVLLRLDALLDYEVDIFIKLDIGYGRTGIHYSNISAIDRMISAFDQTDLCSWNGFLAHAGHSYKCRNKDEIRAIHEASKLAIRTLDPLREKYPDFQISVGDTPTCSVAEDFGWCSEIRPGNFVFYDLTQWKIGSNDLNDIAVALACPVVAKHPERGELVLYGGGSHFAKDRLSLENGSNVWGLLVDYDTRKDNSWTIMDELHWMTSLSQEHGILSVNQRIMDNTKVGDLLTILPVHSCMTALAMGQYWTTEGNNIQRI